MSHQCCSGGVGRPGPKVGVFCTMSPLPLLTHCMSPPPKCISTSKNGCAALHCLSSTQAHFLCEFSFNSLELGFDFQAGCVIEYQNAERPLCLWKVYNLLVLMLMLISKFMLMLTLKSTILLSVASHANSFPSSSQQAVLPCLAHCNVKYNKLNTERRIQNVWHII